MRKQYKLTYCVETEEMQEYLISHYKTEYQIFGPPHRSNHPTNPDFELAICMGDDVAEYLIIHNKDALKKDKNLQRMLAEVSRFTPC